jgi:hypothetical protein
MMTLNLGELDLENVDEIAEVLAALKLAGLSITNIQIQGNRQQTQQFFAYLPTSAIQKRRRQQVLTAMVPAAVGGLSFIVFGLWLWV